MGIRSENHFFFRLRDAGDIRAVRKWSLLVPSSGSDDMKTNNKSTLCNKESYEQILLVGRLATSSSAGPH